MKLLVITGAGASCELGKGDQGLPLMGEWARRLCTALGPELAHMTGLQQAADGPAFEETLGALFRWFDTLDDARRFAPMARQGPVADPAWETSYGQALTHIQGNRDLVVSRLHTSLFHEYGPQRIDIARAVDAYRGLLGSLGDGDDLVAGELIFATTNYDRSIELALPRLGRPARTGVTPDAIMTPRVDPKGLGEFRTGEPSLIYLHGAVGWYRDGDHIVARPADRGYEPTDGEPAVLYPGPDKDPGRVETKELWDEFGRALEEATHIFVLGHHLNDAHLNDALNRSRARIAVTYLNSEPVDQALTEAAERIHAAVPRALLVPARFGPKPQIDTVPLPEWRGRSAA